MAPKILRIYYEIALELTFRSVFGVILDPLIAEALILFRKSRALRPCISRLYALPPVESDIVGMLWMELSWEIIMSNSDNSAHQLARLLLSSLVEVNRHERCASLGESCNGVNDGSQGQQNDAGRNGQAISLSLSVSEGSVRHMPEKSALNSAEKARPDNAR